MNDSSHAAQKEPSYAFGLADDSYQWYRTAAIHSRRSNRISSVIVLIVAAAIPVSAAIAPKNSMVPAVLGAIVVIVSGLRSIFHWEENYLRFSGAREAVEAERRLYLTQSSPYDDSESKDRTLAAKITSIEQQEMAGWIKVAGERGK
jgi:hypothetical protein